MIKMIKSACNIFLAVCIGFMIISCKEQSETKTTTTATEEAAQPSKAPITVAEVNAAQQAWCDALVNIGKTHKEGGDYKAVATAVLSDLYNYDNGKVLFKPTLAYGPQTFRLDKEGAAAYFIGGNPKYPSDNGFALTPWIKVRYDNAGGGTGVLIEGDIAMTMGNVYLTDSKGKEIIVDKTFVFKRGNDGKLRLIVHKSALPFSPEKKS